MKVATYFVVSMRGGGGVEDYSADYLQCIISSVDGLFLCVYSKTNQDVRWNNFSWCLVP